VPQIRKLLLEISEDFFKNQKAIFKEAGGFLRTTLGLYIYTCFWSFALSFVVALLGAEMVYSAWYHSEVCNSAINNTDIG